MNHSEYLKQVGLNIKRIRLDKGIKQIELAYACDFEKQNMQRIEAGKTNVTLKTLLKISEALNVDMIELFKF